MRAGLGQAPGAFEAEQTALAWPRPSKAKKKQREENSVRKNSKGKFHRWNEGTGDGTLFPRIA
jgi:hypothetical protein